MGQQGRKKHAASCVKPVVFTSGPENCTSFWWIVFIIKTEKAAFDGICANGAGSVRVQSLRQSIAPKNELRYRFLSDWSVGLF
jgi:hypothetical protein